MNAITKTNHSMTKAGNNPAKLYLIELSETGRYTMAQALNTLAKLLSSGAATMENYPWHELKYQHVTAIRAKLETMSYKPATINKMLAAVRGTIRAAWRDGQISAEDYFKAVSVKSVKSSELPAGRYVTESEFNALMQACWNDESIAGVRDAAIIGLMYACGPRRDTVIKTLIDDYNKETGEIKFKTKGRKEITAWLTGGAMLAMNDWLKIRGDNLGGLFVPINKGGRITGYERMTSKAIYNMLQKRADEAGVKHFSPHDLRRKFISDLLDAGTDISTVSKMSGHATVSTTARYDRRPEEAKKKAAGLLHVPYRGRA